mmetsp:Transcript_2483/g.6612  ORF Transcript_2483/g.6612 Transcript_2483/m.6612 type:complete len:261 (-) Transcript_2483:142-924(-)
MIMKRSTRTTYETKKTKQNCSQRTTGTSTRTYCALVRNLFPTLRERSRATPEIWGFVIVQVYPVIRGSLLATNDVPCLVIHAPVPHLGIVIHDRWPNKGLSLFWFHVDSQSGKSCCSSFLDVRQVQKERHDSVSRRGVIGSRRRIVVHSVELVFLVFQNLEGLVVHFRDSRHPFYFFGGADHARQSLAFVGAPRIRRGSCLGHDLFHFSEIVGCSLIGRAIKPHHLPTLPDLIGFKLRQEGVKGNNPRSIRPTEFSVGGT